MIRRSSLRRPQVWLLSVAIVTVLALACTGDADDPVAPTIETVRVEAPKKSIEVTGVAPNELARGTVNVDLEVAGSGFESGSTVSFELDGTTTDLITTNSVTYVDQSTLLVNVDVGEDALETLYDVAVRNGPRKKGVGIDLLKVVTPVVYPTVQGYETEGTFGERPTVRAVSGARVVGWDLECSWLYDRSTNVRTCLAVEGLETVYPSDINRDGRIVGTGYTSADGTSVGFVFDLTGGAPATVVSADGWTEVSLYGVTESGAVIGWVKRPGQSSKKGRGQTTSTEVMAFARWNEDLELVALSDTSTSSTGGPMSVSEGGLIAGRFEGSGRVWTGEMGATPFAPESGGYSTGDVMWITPGGHLVAAGTSTGTTSYPLRWVDPYGLPQRAAMIDLTNPFNDDRDNILGRSEQVGGDAFSPAGVCIAPGGSVTRLAPAEGYDSALPRAGSDGIIYGWSRRIEKIDGSNVAFDVVTAWDVSAGC